MIRLERRYIPLIPLSHVGSSKGIFFDTCIIPRITTRLVLRCDKPIISKCGETALKMETHI